MLKDPKSLSVITLFKEMKIADKCNDDSYTWLITKCKSQSMLTSISRKSIGIEGMSLNTFKKYANEEINGGFSAINTLRKKIYNKHSPKHKNHEKKKRQRNHATDIKKKLTEAERYRAILIRAYYDLNQITLDAIKGNPQYEYDYRKHNELYKKYFSITMAVNNE